MAEAAAAGRVTGRARKGAEWFSHPSTSASDVGRQNPAAAAAAGSVEGEAEMAIPPLGEVASLRRVIEIRFASPRRLAGDGVDESTTTTEKTKVTFDSFFLPLKK